MRCLTAIIEKKRLEKTRHLQSHAAMEYSTNTYQEEKHNEKNRRKVIFIHAYIYLCRRIFIDRTHFFFFFSSITAIRRTTLISRGKSESFPPYAVTSSASQWFHPKWTNCPYVPAERHHIRSKVCCRCYPDSSRQKVPPHHNRYSHTRKHTGSLSDIRISRWNTKHWQFRKRNSETGSRNKTKHTWKIRFHRCQRTITVLLLDNKTIIYSFMITCIIFNVNIFLIKIYII